MKNIFLLSLIATVIYSCSDSNNNSTDDLQPQPESTFYKGMDLSFQTELEDYNVQYKDETGNTIDLLDYVANNGTNLVRLRLWHSPANGQNTLTDGKLMHNV